MIYKISHRNVTSFCVYGNMNSIYTRNYIINNMLLKDAQNKINLIGGVRFEEMFDQSQINNIIL